MACNYCREMIFISFETSKNRFFNGVGYIQVLKLKRANIYLDFYYTFSFNFPLLTFKPITVNAIT